MNALEASRAIELTQAAQWTGPTAATVSAATAALAVL